MKIICVDKYQKLHNSNNIEKSLSEMIDNKECPIVYFKPDSSLLSNGKPFFIPDFSSEIYGAAKLVVKSSRLGKNIAERFAHRYYEEITIGLDLTAVDTLDKLKNKNLPWELSKVFDNSAPIGDFVSKESFLNGSHKFSLEIRENDTHSDMQECKTENFLSEIDKSICFISKLVTLKIGDLIFMSLPLDDKKININNHIAGKIDDKIVLDFHIH